MLEVIRLSKSYGNNCVLRDLSLAFAAGTSHVILGASGSGKTTLIKSIAGMLDHYDGKVNLKGKSLAANMRQRSFSELSAIQYIFQDPYSSLDPRQSARQILAKTERICQRHRHNHWPGEEALRFVDQKLLDAWERPVATLSGGQRQKVCIARSLIPKPAVLLSDEACSMLDGESSLDIYNLFNRLKDALDMTILIVKHDIDFEYQEWDFVSLIQDGIILETVPFRHFFAEAKSEYARDLIAAYRYFGKEED